MLADNCYWLNYSVPKQLQEILILAHFHHIYIDQHLSNNSTLSGDDNSNL